MPTSVSDALLRSSTLANEVASGLRPHETARGQLESRANQYAALSAAEWQEYDGEIAAIGCAYDLQTAVASAAAALGGAYVPLEEWVANLVGRNRADGPARRLSTKDPSAVFAEGTGTLGALSDELLRIGGGESVEVELRQWVNAVSHGAAVTVEMVAQVLEAEAAREHVAPPAEVLAELVGVTAFTAAMTLIGLLYVEPRVQVSDEHRAHLVDLARRAGAWALETANPDLR